MFETFVNRAVTKGYGIPEGEILGPPLKHVLVGKRRMGWKERIFCFCQNGAASIPFDARRVARFEGSKRH